MPGPETQAGATRHTATTVAADSNPAVHASSMACYKSGARPHHAPQGRQPANEKHEITKTPHEDVRCIHDHQHEEPRHCGLPSLAATFEEYMTSTVAACTPHEPNLVAMPPQPHVPAPSAPPAVTRAVSTVTPARPGAHVTMHGLTRTPEFNGQSGVVCTRQPESPRVVVMTDEGVAVRVSPQHLRSRACVGEEGVECSKLFTTDT